MSEPRDPAPEPDTEKMPDDEELHEPSTEKAPGEEPKGSDSTPEDADHEAVGIGVFGDAPPLDAETEEVLEHGAGFEETGEAGE